ncbi:N-acetylmuramoyl-L-alanine amidase [Halalkalibaculum sp. DA3122]|uniref:N-acetylmuramoyl-L-alanine amidase family protein n=1 Tax=unclassified Halalkalibaculum TaxID=2964617 RepID=UPI003754FA08
MAHGQADVDNILNRVSTAERSDGEGYVVRFHLEQQVDSFKVMQSRTDLIQMTLYGEQINSSEIEYDTTTVVYDEIGFYNHPLGVGVDLYIPEDQYFIANAYHDRHSSDLLLGLTFSSEERVSTIAENIDPIIWSSLTISRDSLLAGPSGGFSSDNDYQLMKDKIRFDVVVIDPGHGGHDPGAIGYKGTREKDVVLDISKKLGGYINEYLPDVKVVYTREDDSFVGLEERGEIANKAEGDLFISIHCNVFSNRNTRGTEVYFLGLHRSQAAFEVMKKENSVIRFEEGPDRSEELTEEDLLIYELANSAYMATSEKLAGMLEHQFDHRAKRHSRGVKQAGFIVLFHASMPALLVETGFISNPSEQRYLTSDYGQSIIASAIFRAIRNYKLEYEKSQNFKTN